MPLVFFDAQLPGSTAPEIPPPTLDFLDDFETDMLYVFGHIEKHSQVLSEKIAELEQIPLPPDRQANFDRIKLEFRTKLKESEREAKIELLDYMKTRWPDIVPMMEKIMDARSATYDKTGQLRTTSATPVYEKILKDWDTVESFSGPAELCRYLEPILGKREWEEKYELVKKLCRRMGIEFKPCPSRDKLEG